jgi:hypothetical protein
VMLSFLPKIAILNDTKVCQIYISNLILPVLEVQKLQTRCHTNYALNIWNNFAHSNERNTEFISQVFLFLLTFTTLEILNRHALSMETFKILKSEQWRIK